MGIQIYDQVSIRRSWSKVKLCGLIRVWLKGVKNNDEHHESWRALLYSKCTSKYSILRNCSKVKLCHAFSLRLGLKGVKIIAQNVAKFAKICVPLKWVSKSTFNFDF